MAAPLYPCAAPPLNSEPVLYGGFTDSEVRVLRQTSAARAAAGAQSSPPPPQGQRQQKVQHERPADPAASSDSLALPALPAHRTPPRPGTLWRTDLPVSAPPGGSQPGIATFSKASR